MNVPSFVASSARKVSLLFLQTWFLWFWIFIIVFLLFITIHTVLDPDLGWHLRLGKDILATGIPLTDPYSYTMPSYPFIDHEWLWNVGVFSGLQVVGENVVLFLYTLCTLIVFLPFLLQPRKYLLFPFILTSSILLSRFSLRPQVISWIGFSWLAFLLLNPTQWKRFRYIVPVLMILWVNLHGSFALAFGLISLYVFFRLCIEKVGDKIDGVVLLFSGLGTLLNPYGIFIWKEIVSQITDTQLHRNIIEWGRFYEKVEFSFLGLATVILFLVYRYRKSLSSFLIVTTSGMLFLGVSALRHIPLFMIWGIGMYSLLFEYVEKETPVQYRRRVYTFSAILICVAFLFFSVEAMAHFRAIPSFSESTFYPQYALNILKSKKIEGNILSKYGWGGYLLWKLPKYKVFIDGRMPSFRWKAPDGESEYAFEDYKDLVYGRRVNELLEKYNIHTILWTPYESVDDALPIFNSNASSRVPSPLLEYIEQNGWQLIYEDDSSRIYVR